MARPHLRGMARRTRELRCRLVVGGPKPIRSLVGALALLVLPLVGAASAGAATLDQSLERIVDARGGPPGVSVLIQRGRQQEFRRAGVADVRTGRAPTRGDHLRIASVSKGFSSVVALALAEERRLSLDDTIGARLPGVLPLADPVTLRQALQHTGGLPDYIRTKTFLAQFTSDPAAYMSPRQLVAFVRGDPLEFRPARRYHYSDTDNIVVGLMAEAVSGRSYERLLASEIFGPLRMRQTQHAAHGPHAAAVPARLRGHARQAPSTTSAR